MFQLKVIQNCYNNWNQVLERHLARINICQKKSIER